MTNFLRRVGVGLTTAVLLAGTLAPAALADTTIDIINNGESSTNTATVNTSCSASISQGNSTNIEIKKIRATA